MASEKVANYSAEMTEKVVSMYNDKTSVEEIAKAVGKSVKSVIAKLVREKVYVSKATSAKSEVVTKADLVAKIGVALNIELGVIESLEKATKEALTALAAAVEDLASDEEPFGFGD